jgi:hypothetical protein
MAPFRKKNFSEHRQWHNRYNRRNLTGVEKFESALLKVSNTRITYNTLTGK